MIKVKRNLTTVLFFCFCTSFGQATNIAERLGYPKDSKLLIIHADDLGVSHSENTASIKAMEKGSVNSASIMVPCPWFPEIANYAKNNPEKDFGLHLTITSEWKYYKWGPVASKDSVKSLINPEGYFYDLVPKVVQNANAENVAIELDRQVKKAFNAGIDVTHLDAHMGAAMATKDFLKAYIKLGHKYKVPVMLSNQINAMKDKEIQSLLTENDVVANATLTAVPDNFKNTMKKFYRNLFNNLEGGLNVLLIHTAYDDDEMQAITIDHPDWGATWRQEDFDFFTSDLCKNLLEKNDIVLVTWREIRDKITRAKD
jgi:predicted glycoside hydrolase/deacetylase ChbG (UPF0249 family)